MNEVDKELQNQINTLSGKLNDHMMSRLENDKVIAVALQKIEDTTQNIHSEVKKTNGRVTAHDVQFTEFKGKVDTLYEAHMQKMQSSGKIRDRWMEYFIKVCLVVLGIILTKLGIINFNLPF